MTTSGGVHIALYRRLSHGSVYRDTQMLRYPTIAKYSRLEYVQPEWNLNYKADVSTFGLINILVF